ncbi:MAG TPA: DnaA/Hda family protein [Chlamydiales bacterium]|nr:DnaA/Hda family protein [Chlamydiales bacterium]
MQAWEEFLHKMEMKLGKKTIDQWVRSIQITQFDARNLYLESPDPLQINWFEEHIRPLLKNGIFNNNGRPIQVYLNKTKKSEGTIEKAPFTILSDRLNPELTFENFIASSENMVAFKLLQEATVSFNPIFLYGPQHTGKTHLLTAAAHLYQSVGKKVFFVRAETFTSHVVQAIRLGHMDQFRSIYRDIDVLIVDDVSCLAKKFATQEEFFHTFNVLHTAGKQIILSSLLPPSKLQEIEQRLLSRFEWGISLLVGRAPSIEILTQKAALWKLSYSPELIRYLAEQFAEDPLLALEALRVRTKGMSSLTPEKASQFLQDLIAQKKAKMVTSEKIIADTANHFGIRIEDILGKSHKKEFTYPRQIAMYFCRTKLQLPFQKIGSIFKRDHSTVIASIKQIQTGREGGSGSIESDICMIEKK